MASKPSVGSRAELEALDVAGGRPPGGPEFERGHYLVPTIFLTEDPSQTLVREEVFGTVAAVIPFETEEDAVRLANDDFAGGVWTRDIGRALRVASPIRAGTVWVNAYDKTYPRAPIPLMRPPSLPSRQRGGRRHHDGRCILDGMRSGLHTGVPWREQD